MSICQKTLDDPRALPCLHVFCKTCISQRIEGPTQLSLDETSLEDPSCLVECPVCKEKHIFLENNADTLRTSFLHKAIAEELFFQERKQARICTSCDEQAKATHVCKNCSEFLCEDCKIIHHKLRKTKAHKLVTMDDFSKNPTLIKLMHGQMMPCSIHPSEDMQLFCEATQAAICSLCAFSAEHHLHPATMHKPLDQKLEDTERKLNVSLQQARQQANSKFSRREELEKLMQQISESSSNLKNKVASETEMLLKTIKKYGDDLQESLQMLTDQGLAELKYEDQKIDADIIEIEKLGKQAEIVKDLPGHAKVLALLDMTEHLHRLSQHSHRPAWQQQRQQKIKDMANFPSIITNSGNRDIESFLQCRLGRAQKLNTFSKLQWKQIYGDEKPTE